MKYELNADSRYEVMMICIYRLIQEANNHYRKVAGTCTQLVGYWVLRGDNVTETLRCKRTGDWRPISV